jgi:hypothetical protein
LISASVKRSLSVVRLTMNYGYALPHDREVVGVPRMARLSPERK